MVLQPFSFVQHASFHLLHLMDYKLGVKLFLPLIDFQSDLLTDSHNS